MANVLDELLDRGYIKQFTHEEETRELLEQEKITFYIGFDPTADSLHVGHFIAMMFMAHMQKAGHRPIALLGGGTAMVGDPSGKTDMRSMLTKEQIEHNVSCIKKQMEKFIDFSDDKAILVNNADWLLNLNYVDFLREVGVHFSVNRMLTAECFKQRLEKGLSRSKLSENTDVSPKTIQRAENGKKVMHYCIEKIAKALGVDESVLIDDKREEVIIGENVEFLE